MEGLIATALSAGAVYGLIALATTVVYQSVGVLNFSFTIVGTIGAYCTIAMIGADQPLLFSLAMGFAASACASLLVGMTINWAFAQADMTTRSSVTLIFALAFLALAERIFGDDPRLAPRIMPEGGLLLGEVVVTHATIIAVLVAVVVLIATDVTIKRTRLGHRLQAISENVRTAILADLPVRSLVMGLWLIAGGFAYIAILLIMPSRPVSIQVLTLLMLPGFAAALLGAFDSVRLALVGGFLLGLMEALAAQTGSVIIRGVLPFCMILAALLWLQWSKKWDDAR